MTLYMNLKKEEKMEEKKQSVDLSAMSAEEKAALLAQLQSEEQTNRLSRREAYEALRKDFLQTVKESVTTTAEHVGKQGNFPIEWQDIAFYGFAILCGSGINAALIQWMCSM